MVLRIPEPRSKGHAYYSTISRLKAAGRNGSIAPLALLDLAVHSGRKLPDPASRQQ